IAPAELAKTQIRGDVDAQDLTIASSQSELAVQLVRQRLRQEFRGRSANLLPAPAADQLISRARDGGFLPESTWRRVMIELQRAGDTFNAHDGQITHPDLQALLADHFGPEYIYSASGLSAYGNCP